MDIEFCFKVTESNHSKKEKSSLNQISNYWIVNRITVKIHNPNKHRCMWNWPLRLIMIEREADNIKKTELCVSLWSAPKSPLPPVPQAVAGLLADARSLAEVAREEASNFRSNYGHDIPLKVLQAPVLYHLVWFFILGLRSDTHFCLPLTFCLLPLLAYWILQCFNYSMSM